MKTKLLLFLIAFFGAFAVIGFFGGLYMQKLFETDQTAALATYGLIPLWLMNRGIPPWLWSSLLLLSIPTGIVFYIRAWIRGEQKKADLEKSQPTFREKLQAAYRKQQEGGSNEQKEESGFSKRLKAAQEKQLEEFKQKQEERKNKDS